MDDKPNLPGLYDLIVVESADSARAHAERLADEGAPEGTLVWVKKQTEGLGRRGKYWISGDKNLHCAVVLRPDDPLPVCCELGLVTTVATAQAITVVAEPLEELRLGWPNDVYLNRGKVAGVHMSGRLDREGRVAWAVVAINVNTFAEPHSLGVAASSLRGEGFEFFHRTGVLESFSREFLVWLDRWAAQGLVPVVKAWSHRGGWEGERAIEYAGHRHLGAFESVEDSGALKLRTRQGIISLDLPGFFGPEFAVPGRSDDNR